MAYCGKCGTQILDDVKFCSSCGAEINVISAEQTEQAQQSTQQNVGYVPPVVPGAPTQEDIREVQDNKTMAILAYILFLIPLLTGAHEKSPFVKYHTNQGLALFIFDVVFCVLFFILMLIPFIGWILTGILALVWISLFVSGVLNALNGVMKPLPIIGGINIIK